MRPGTTKSVTLTTGYQRLAKLYDSNFSDAIKTPDGAEVANQVFITNITASAEVAYGDTIPIGAGHLMATGDSMTMSNQTYIQKAWVRGAATAVLIMTPIFE